MSTSSPAPLLDASTPETVVRFHLSLNVSNIDRSQAFYRVLLGSGPAKARDDYVKFELDEPPLVLSLVPAIHTGGGALNHVGLRLTSGEQLVALQARLEAAGYRTQREEGVACCYARQTKFWVADSDRTLWEIYILHDDDVEHGPGAVTADAGCCETAVAAPVELVGLAQCGTPSGVLVANTAVPIPAAPVMWLHNLLEPLPERLEQADESIDEVQLQGTFNVPHDPLRLAAFLAEVLRVLRPLGRVLAHGLVADRPLAAAPELPGPAALVSYVPLEVWPAESLALAGFVNVELVQLGATPCFTVEGVELREFKVIGRKPAAQAAAPAGWAIYRGSFRTVTDDQGQTFPRGQRVAVSEQALAQMKISSAAGQFTFPGDPPARDRSG